MKYKEMLEEELKNRLEELDETALLSEQYKDGIKDIVTIYDAINEDNKVENERAKIENDRKKNTQEALLKIGGYAVEIATFVGGIIFVGKCYDKGLLFEKEGEIIKSDTVKNCTKWIKLPRFMK